MRQDLGLLNDCGVMQSDQRIMLTVVLKAVKVKVRDFCEGEVNRGRS